MESNTALEAPSQVAFDVDEAVLQQVAEFLQQQKTAMVLEGPGEDGNS